jgi:hypothetical protein
MTQDIVLHTRPAKKRAQRAGALAILDDPA